MRTEREFVDHWKRHLAGVIALGTTQLRKKLSVPMLDAEGIGEVIFDVSDQAEKLLSRLYQDLFPRPAEKPTEAAKAPAPAPAAARPAPAANGTPAPATQARK